MLHPPGGARVARRGAGGAGRGVRAEDVKLELAIRSNDANAVARVEASRAEADARGARVARAIAAVGLPQAAAEALLAPLAGDDDKCVGDTEGEACAIACAADPPADWGVNVSRCRDLCCGASQRFFPATCDAGAATPGGKGCFMQCCRETSSSAVAVAGKPISACFSSADAAESSAACAAQCCGGGVCGGNLRASGSAAVAARSERAGGGKHTLVRVQSVVHL